VFTLKTAFAALALVTLPVACASKNNAANLATDSSGAEDVTTTESDVEALGSSFVGGNGQSAATQSFAPGSSELRLQDNTTRSNPGFWFSPAGCETTTVDNSAQKATYVFNGCSGPLGLVEVSGTIDLSWQLSGDQLTLDFSASGFKINRSTIDSWQATAVVTASGDQRTMTWSAQLSGTTGRGRHFTRTNQKTLSWSVGVACLSVSGQSTGDILGRTLQTTFVSWKRCADSCPEAGSEINVKDITNGDDIDIKYLGGPDADLTLNGKTEEIGLACGL
jgi:hypothetical protein